MSRFYGSLCTYSDYSGPRGGVSA